MFQTRWYWLSVVILFLSFVSWIGAAYCISALLIADYNFFYVRKSALCLLHITAYVF